MCHHTSQDYVHIPYGAGTVLHLLTVKNLKHIVPRMNQECCWSSGLYLFPCLNDPLQIPSPSAPSRKKKKALHCSFICLWLVPRQSLWGWQCLHTQKITHSVVDKMLPLDWIILKLLQKKHTYLPGPPGRTNTLPVTKEINVLPPRFVLEALLGNSSLWHWYT